MANRCRVMITVVSRAYKVVLLVLVTVPAMVCIASCSSAATNEIRAASNSPISQVTRFSNAPTASHNDEDDYPELEAEFSDIGSDAGEIRTKVQTLRDHVDEFVITAGQFMTRTAMLPI